MKHPFAALVAFLVFEGMVLLMNHPKSLGRGFRGSMPLASDWSGDEPDPDEHAARERHVEEWVRLTRPLWLVVGTALALWAARIAGS